MNELYAVILAGGRGERFWPLSTAARPKQLLRLFGERTLLAETVERIAPLIPPERVFIVTNREIAAATRAAVPQVPGEQVVGEPVGRDTAAAAATGTALVRRLAPDGVVCMLTADHVIGDAPRFLRTLADGAALARDESSIVTIGIPPTFPSTGFGYIEGGERLGRDTATVFHRALRFVEKPDAKRAAEYVAGGRHFWNSGMFLWSCAGFQRELRRLRPALADMTDRLAEVPAGPAFEAALEREYPPLEKISVDFAIMEHASRIDMALASFAWDDVGSWPALENHFPADAAGNVFRGRCEALDASGNLVVSEERLTALLGVRDLIVVQAAGATLVCHRERAQDLKRLVQAVAKRPDAAGLV